MTKLICSVDGCDTPAKTRGWCMRHYQQQYRGAALIAPIIEVVCAHCEASFSASNGKIYCSQKCREQAKYAVLKGDPVAWAKFLAKSNANYTKVSDRPGYVKPVPVVCSIDGCGRRLEALGLCRTHYRASRPRRADTKVPMPCDGCGEIVMKVKRAARWDTVQCGSALCRYWLRWGAWSSELPEDHMARCIGQSCEWVFKEKPAPFEPRPFVDHLCAWCGAPFTSNQSRATFCSKKCNKSRARRLRRAREFDAPGEFTWTEVTRLWISFDKRCAYCLTPTKLSAIEGEHVQALARGGRNDLSNLLPSCSACNSDKRDLTLNAWGPDRARRHLPAVKTQWPVSDKRYWHLAS